MRSFVAALLLLVVLAAECALPGHAALQQSGQQHLRAGRLARGLLQSRSTVPGKGDLTDDSAWMQATQDTLSISPAAPPPPPPDSPRGKQNGPQDSKGLQGSQVQVPSPEDDWLAGWGSVLVNQKAPKEPRAPRSPRKPTTPPDAPQSPPDAPIQPPSPPKPPSPRPQSPRPPSPRPPTPRPAPPRPSPAKSPVPATSQLRPPVPRRLSTGLIGERGEEARPPPPSPSTEWLAGAGKGSTSPLINPAILLDAHNRYRVLSGVANLTWDSALSRQAQAWADKCVAGHSGTPGTGENIAWGVYMEPEETLSGVISWANEICNYDWKNPGFTAGHYTQIVWKSTRRVGCGYKLCNPSPGGGSRNGWLVCQYQPPGNMQGTQNYRDNVIQPKVLPTTCDAVGPGWGTVGR